MLTSEEIDLFESLLCHVSHLGQYYTSGDLVDVLNTALCISGRFVAILRILWKLVLHQRHEQVDGRALLWLSVLRANLVQNLLLCLIEYRWQFRKL